MYSESVELVEEESEGMKLRGESRVARNGAGGGVILDIAESYIAFYIHHSTGCPKITMNPRIFVGW